MKFSINTNSLRKNLSPAEIVKLAVSCGVDGIEWGNGPLDNAPAELSEMFQRTTDAGLEVLSYINVGCVWHTDELRRWSEAAVGKGTRILRVAHPWFAWDYAESVHQPDSFVTLMQKTREGLERAAELGREYDLRYVLETHSGSTAASPLAVHFLMQGLDPRYVGAIYDVTNTYLEGFIRPRGAAELMNEYLAYIHVKGLTTSLGDPVISGNRARMNLEYRPTYIQSGWTDYNEVAFAMNCINWDGYWSFEEMQSSNNPEAFVAEIKEAREYLKQCADNAPKAPCEPFTHFND